MWGVKASQKASVKGKEVAVAEDAAEGSTPLAVESASMSIEAAEEEQPSASEDVNGLYRPVSFANPPRMTVADAPGEKRLVCTVKLSCYHADLQNLVFFTRFVEHVAAAFAFYYHRARSLPVKTSLRTVPRSPFVHKPAQENFMKKVHARSIDIYNADMDAVKQFIEYISENGMSNVRMQVRLYERKELGFGKSMLELEAGDLEKTDEEKVREIAQGILNSDFAEGGASDSTGDSRVQQVEEQPAKEAQEIGQLAT